MINILKALIDGLDLSIYSYVKPAAPHRFSTHFTDLHTYVKAVTDALGEYVKAIERGFRVAEGRLGLDRVGLGELIRSAISSSAKNLHLRGVHNLHLILLPVVITASYAYKLEGKSSNFINRFNRGLKDILLYTSTQEVLKIYNALRTHEGVFKELLTRISITPGRIESEGMNLLDFYSELGTVDRTLKFFARNYVAISRYGQKYVNIYVKTGDYNLATIQVFTDIALDVANVKLPIAPEGMSNIVKSLKIDRELIRKGLDLSDIIPILTSSIFVGNVMIQ
ncbi:MAG: hypothetical protein B6U85_03825 [Desulfurococcales archaeon ex4484_42]|nr:MAG: hypothetical protein B6U85_03825 [Desulfurococcales archaeon ex4484_42]